MIAVALAFASAALAVTGIAMLMPDGVLRLRGRRREASAEPRATAGARAMRALARTGNRLGPLARLAAPRELEGRIAAAGLAGPLRGPLTNVEPREVMAAKLAAALLAMTAGLMLGAASPGRLGAALAVVGPVTGFLAPDLWLMRRARARARVIRRELPAMLDLLRVTIEAGLPLTAALSAVGERTSGALGAEWRVVAREVALGVPLARSLRAMADRCPGPEVAALVGAIERAARHGTPLAETLAAQAHDAREARRRRVREEAARAGPKIQLVVALLLVPSVLLLVAAALAAALIDERGGLALT